MTKSCWPWFGFPVNFPRLIDQALSALLWSQEDKKLSETESDLIGQSMVGGVCWPMKYLLFHLV